MPYFQGQSENTNKYWTFVGFDIHPLIVFMGDREFLYKSSLFSHIYTNLTAQTSMLLLD